MCDTSLPSRCFFFFFGGGGEGRKKKNGGPVSPYPKTELRLQRGGVFSCEIPTCAFTGCRRPSAVPFMRRSAAGPPWAPPPPADLAPGGSWPQRRAELARAQQGALGRRRGSGSSGGRRRRCWRQGWPWVYGGGGGTAYLALLLLSLQQKSWGGGGTLNHHHHQGRGDGQWVWSLAYASSLTWAPSRGARLAAPSLSLLYSPVSVSSGAP